MKIVLFKNSYSYCNFMCSDLNEIDDNVLIIEPIDIRSNYIKRIYLKILRSINVNKYYQFFLEMYIKGSISYDDEVCFISFDSSPTAHIDFTNVIKKIYPNSKSVLIVYNSLENNDDRAKAYSSHYDLVYSFDPFDAQKYGWRHFLGLMPTYCESIKMKKVFDVSFIGNDKGRYQQIKEIYVELKKQGLNCFFYVISDKSPKDRIDHLLLHHDMMDFDDLLFIEQQSKCLLDITSVNNHRQGLSLRVLEAIYCNAKIITDNLFVEEFSVLNINSIYYQGISSLKPIKSFLLSPAHYDKIEGLGFGIIIDSIKESLEFKSNESISTI